MIKKKTSCALCHPQNEENILWCSDRVRVILVADEKAYPGWCRVIWQAHCEELSNLSEVDYGYFMHIVYLVEKVIREVMQPDKMNVVSLGNQVAHVHWHLIPRYKDDAHFPQSVWANPLRQPFDSKINERHMLVKSLAKNMNLVLSKMESVCCL